MRKLSRLIKRNNHKNSDIGKSDDNVRKIIYNSEIENVLKEVYEYVADDNPVIEDIITKQDLSKDEMLGIINDINI